MSIDRVLQLMWNHQISFFKINPLRRLSSSFVTSNNLYSTFNHPENRPSDQSQSSSNQINSNEANWWQAEVHQNLVEKWTKKTDQQHRLNALRDRLNKGDDLKDFKEFINQKDNSNFKTNALVSSRKNLIPYLPEDFLDGDSQKVYIETYGCQMNVNDSQIAARILSSHNYEIVSLSFEICLIMTCSIREGAEKKIFRRLRQLKRFKNHNLKTVCLAGCMASRLKDKVLEKDRLVDIVVGPDNYRSLPNLLAWSKLSSRNALNVILSYDETYADIMPVIKLGSEPQQSNQSFERTDCDENIELNNWSQFKENDAKKAFVSIMRGCDNMCSYCVVPYTRGRERSRPIETILNEISLLSKAGVKEVTLLGQNVISYRDYDSLSIEKYKNSSVGHRKDFRTIYKKEKKGGVTFDILLEQVALIDRNMRIRFTSPHPKDFTDEVINVIAKYPNICNHLNLPGMLKCLDHFGDDGVLARMRRGYTAESYLQLVCAIREKIPNCTFTSDFIAGFVGESEEAHQRTLELIEKVKYTFLYAFPYSVRENTYANLHHPDDVPFDIKERRSSEIHDAFRSKALEHNSSLIGKEQLILIEGPSRKSENVLFGRNESNIKMLVPSQELEDRSVCTKDNRKIQVGDYVVARVHHATSQTLHGTPLYITTLVDFYSNRNDDVLKAAVQF